MNQPRPGVGTVVIIDDDASVRAMIRSVLESVGCAVVEHEVAESYLSAGPPARPCCLLVDMRMPRMSGLSLIRRLADDGDAPPVILMTGHADVSVAVETFRAGAFDFVQKPPSMHALMDIIARALEEDGSRLAEREARAKLQLRLGSLSARERDVADHIVEGLSNKEIARVLCISPRTVERHRDQIFEKMDVRNAVELVGALGAPPRGAG